MHTININLFNEVNDDQKIFEYHLTNKNGIQVSFIEYGATITSIKIHSGLLFRNQKSGLRKLNIRNKRLIGS